MLCPTEPRRYGLTVFFQWWNWLSAVQACNGTAKVLFDALAHKTLATEELIADIIESASVNVVTVIRYREHLIIAFDGQVQLTFEIVTNEW